MNVNSLIEDIIGEDKPVAAMNRKERDRQLRKADILRAAERIFALKGYHDATIQDIAKEAQYATGTVYLYFKDKEELYFSLFEQKMRGLFLILKKDISSVKDAKSRIQIFIRDNLVFFEKNSDFFKIVLLESNKIQAIRGRKLSNSEIILRHKDFVAELIKSAQEHGLIKEDYPARQVAEVLVAILMSVVFDWLRDGLKQQKSLTDMTDFILNIFLSGAGRHR